MGVTFTEDTFVNRCGDKVQEESILDEKRIESRPCTPPMLPSDTREVCKSSAVEDRTQVPVGEIYGGGVRPLQLGDSRVLAAPERVITTAETKTKTEPCPPFYPPESQALGNDVEGEPSPETDDFADRSDAASTLSGPPSTIGGEETEVDGDRASDESISSTVWTTEGFSENAAPLEATIEGRIPNYDDIMAIKRLEEIDDDSPSRLEWLRQRRKERASNKYIDKVMEMVGREDIKSHFLKMKARIETAKRQQVNILEEHFSTAFFGNPGTGMTPDPSTVKTHKD
ncbi:hypothetical protein GP486_005723 [Trichoglossum hirsutum]|uniref:Uncharacterized protein n=1 Tax=Trichoglossum hirsutum TaxID=265104 RepID=A0A9P8L8N4_9PEZI|nr:hypothetical protein GP486_005723 [Trichoglossum hirsutum]